LAHRIAELFGFKTDEEHDWEKIVSAQKCPYSGKKCFKIRKSDATVSIGTCVVRFGKNHVPLIICPNKFLANCQVFTDCLPLISHKAGNELHIVPEVTVPGGSVDYFLVSARDGNPSDFVGIEFQALDTTGSLWPSRQKVLSELGVDVDGEVSGTSAGVNWKMTAKTTLVQLHHKIETFESLSKKFVLVLQDKLLEYMQSQFEFGHLSSPESEEDSMYFHAYRLFENALALETVKSTNRAGIATALNLGASAEMKPEMLVQRLKSKMSDSTRWSPLE